ncbi:thioesterase family protein [Desulfoluna sp.]|uniref:thioesterase family protein n=1 Tax=Desulfoluna sp. TaxID=2045199 RepID=UPI002602195E|nr:thioesterase family protein [Desulfoluna sp.]
MTVIDFEELFEILVDFYENQMPFNKLIGMKMERLDLETAVVKIAMKDELVGNAHKDILHGGVIASALDFTGGVIAQLSVIKKMKHATPEELTRRLTRMGTIDMRVDYIRPGKGDYFTVTGELLRLGNKVAVVRSQFFNEAETLIAAGTGTYLVG